MQRILSIVGVIGLLGFAGAVKGQERITVPEGTQIMGRLAIQLDSGQARIGDQVTMDVLEDLKIQNAVAVPHGAIIMGHVTEAKGARKMGRGGKLEITFETVTAADGTKIPISGERSEKGKGGYGGGSLVAAGAAGLFFPPAGALLLLKHGHASVIPVGTLLPVRVTKETIIAATRPVEIQAPVPAQPVPLVSPMPAQRLTDTTASDVAHESVADAARRLRAEKAARAAQAKP
jgi:hypothetical protein